MSKNWTLKTKVKSFFIKMVEASSKCQKFGLFEIWTAFVLCEIVTIRQSLLQQLSEIWICMDFGLKASVQIPNSRVFGHFRFSLHHVCKQYF